MEKLAEVLLPSSFELIDSSTEKVNYLLEGNKREFTTGVSYSVLKETIVKLIDSKYFENNTNVKHASSSSDKEETVSAPVQEPEPISHVQTVETPKEKVI